ncbi:MAG: T9SS type A sorting domain-containing protein, partial [Flavobacteriales bacterium]|nr:T9SS type A sorting domain-containing protein [Flavobacteriales bacterium]
IRFQGASGTWSVPITRQFTATASPDNDGDGLCDALDPCPLLANFVPGQSCNDNNACTVNDVVDANCTCAGVFADADNDGTCDASDLCPGGPEPGSSCDDGNASTSGDVIGPNCACAGALIDCLGVPGGPAIPGTACNDNNACTTNDIYQLDCGCVGSFQDNDADGTCDANDLCPGGPEPGSPCNDNNANTINDVVGATCACSGTPIAGCDDWTLEFTTDNAGNESSWQIIDATTQSVIGSGGPYASNTTTIATICIPTGACYRLTVTDANGMSNGTTGGFVLRDPNGKRVLDNAGDGAFTGFSQAVAPFCSPVGNDGLIASQCDKVDWLPGGLLITTPNSAVSAQYGVGTQTDDGYEFRIYNPDGGYDRTVFTSHANPVPGAPAGANAACYLGFSSLITDPVPADVLLNVRVRSAVNGVYSTWGPACRFKIDAAAANCPSTKLITTPGTTFSCGATGKVVNASGAAGRIYAQPATRPVGGVNQAANAYLFELTNTTNGYTRLIGATSYVLVLGKWATTPLLCGTHTYNVRVRASFNGGATYCPWGAVCTVGITNNFAAPYCTAPSAPAMAAGDDRVFFDGDETSTGVLNLWPNPNNGEQLYVTIDGLRNEVATATVDIFDMVGHKVATHTIAVNGSTLNSVIDLDASMANGLYMVNVTAGDEQFNQRLMIQ